MTDFNERLQKAIGRGLVRGVEETERDKKKRLSEEEIRGLYTKYRLELSEHIEGCLGHLPTHFPGFEVETIFGDRGWGAAVSRDDLSLPGGGQRKNLYSRLEMTVRPASSYGILDMHAKGTIQNKELFRRQHFQEIATVDLQAFKELVDHWALEFAEQYAATKP